MMLFELARVFNIILNLFPLGAEAPGSSLQVERSEGSEGAGTFFKYNPNISLSIKQQRQKLPVFKVCFTVFY